MCTHRGALVELVGAPLAADATASVPSPCQWGGACPLVNIFYCTPVNISKCEHLSKPAGELLELWTYLAALWWIYQPTPVNVLYIHYDRYWAGSAFLLSLCEHLNSSQMAIAVIMFNPAVSVWGSNVIAGTYILLNPTTRWGGDEHLAHVKFLLVWHILRRTSQTSASLHGEHLNQVKSAKWCSSNMGHILPMWMFYCDTACYEHLNQVKICPI